MTKRLQAKTYDSMLQKMGSEKEWTPEFRNDITKAFKNCAYEGHKISEEYKNMDQKNLYLKRQHQNFTAEIEATKKELEEKDQKIYKIKEVAAENKLESVKTQLQKREEFIEQLKEQNAKEKREANERIETLKNEHKIEVETKVEKQKQLFKMIADTPISDEPLWIISRKFCNSIYESHQKDANLFVYSFVKELFTLGEIILPKQKLKQKKIKEATAVLAFYFYKSVNNERILEDALNKRRSEIRQTFYQKVNKNGIIAINIVGEYYFYKSDSFGRLLPFKDSQCSEVMNVFVFQKNYGIPEIYKNCGFITVFHISPSDGIHQHYLHPESGYFEENIHSVSKIVKKE
uniref:Uncharacterized protein n=1 Tax=Panagrolaimus superbus TaxID=310955 RepID=A0A914Z6R1_9BILA